MSNIIPSLFLIFLLCLTMHACEARHKGFGVPFQHSGKGVFLDVEKFRLGMDSTKGSVMKEDATAEKGHGVALIQDTKDSKTTAIKGQKFTSGGQKSGMEYAGSENIVESSGHMGLLKATSTSTTTNKEEASRRELFQPAKEAVLDSKSYEKVEDNVVFTDYNPPHQTPPIHNRKT